MMIKRDVQRLFDMVRYCRAILHEDQLITGEEYAELASSRGSVERIEKYDKQAAQIAQLKKQLAEETAERKRLEDNEDAMVAYHDELERDLAEADDALDRSFHNYNGVRDMWSCLHCCKRSERPSDIAHSEHCPITKAKARIEARKGKPK
jgi:hypothetical protein